MSEKAPSKDEALEALDFIVNVLKEHEKDLDRLISELGSVTGQMGDTGDMSGKVAKVEERIDGLQKEISNLVNCFSASSRVQSAIAEVNIPSPKLETKAVPSVMVSSVPVVLRCRLWDDFVSLSCQGEIASFIFNEADKTFRVEAVRNNQVISYCGQLPDISTLLKFWLSKNLDVSEKRVLEGEISTR